MSVNATHPYPQLLSLAHILLPPLLPPLGQVCFLAAWVHCTQLNSFSSGAETVCEIEDLKRTGEGRGIRLFMANGDAGFNEHFSTWCPNSGHQTRA